MAPTGEKKTLVNAISEQARPWPVGDPQGQAALAKFPTASFGKLGGEPKLLSRPKTMNSDKKWGKGFFSSHLNRDLVLCKC